jgi:hypothetical protein
MRSPWNRIPPIDEIADADTSYVQLASALCSVPFVPYRTLRAVRRFLCPEVSELRFCESGLVDGLAADGITLDRGVRVELRPLLRTVYGNLINGPDQRAVQALRRILDEHAKLLSPLLAIEERLLWAWLTNGDDATFRRECDRHLKDVLGTAIFERRQRIFRWAAAAARRLPFECFDSDLGWMLGQLCRTRGIEFPTVKPPSNPFVHVTLSPLIDGLPDRLVGLYRDGEYLELGPVNLRRHVAIPVVDTDPVVIAFTVGHGDGSTAWLPRYPLARIPVGRESIKIRDLRGRTYELAAFDGDESPEMFEARQAVERAVACQESGEAVRYEVLRPWHAGFIVELIDVGLTAVLVETLAELQPGATGYATITKVYPDRRRVYARRFDAQARLGRRGFQVDEAVGDVPERVRAEVVRLGKNSGSIYVELPADHPLWSSTPDGPGVIRFEDAARRLFGGRRPPVGSWVDLVLVRDPEGWFVASLDSDTINIPPRRLDSVDVLVWDPVPMDRWMHLRIVGTAHFGVFVELPDGRQGLLHVNEMAPPVQLGKQPHRYGDLIRVRTLHVDDAERRISFTQRPW